jgi:phage tail-like protein
MAGATNGQDGTGQYFTLAGQKRRLFSTRSIRLPAIEEGEGAALNGTGDGDGAPEAAVARRFYRSQLPAIYQDGDFGLRFVEGLEHVLDPIVALLDSLHAHVDPDLAPLDVLDLMGAWLGVEEDESLPEERQRELVRRAAELARRHGTKGGLELALKISFPALPLRVEDSGKVVYGMDADELPAAKTGFVVYCDAALDEDELAAVARMIEQIKPVNVPYKLRVKAGQKKTGTRETK